MVFTMKKSIIIELETKSQNDPVSVQVILVNEKGHQKSIPFELDKPTGVIEAYNKWQKSYLSSSPELRGDKPIINDQEYGNTSALIRYSFQEYKNLFELWLEKLAKKNNLYEDCSFFIIRTNSEYLRKLFWHNWNVIKDHPHAAVVYEIPQERVIPQFSVSKERVRILVILANTEGLNTDEDERAWREFRSQFEKNLSYLDIDILKYPKVDVLNYVLQKNEWDIIYFAGHGPSNENISIIDINKKEQLEVQHFCDCIIQAKGLKLVIFNCCDSMGLATLLIKKGIPQVIAMREPVLDKIARKFLKKLLEEFPKKVFLHLAFKEVQKSLELDITDYPGSASVIALFQGTNKVPLSWSEFHKRHLNYKLKYYLKGLLIGIIGATLIVATGLGWFIQRPRDLIYNQSQPSSSISKFNSSEMEDSTVFLYSEAEPLSGVIFSKKPISNKRYIYYVLTSNLILDVIETPSQDFILIPSGGEKYPISKNKIFKVKDLNLVISSFESDKLYKVAQLSKSEDDAIGDTLYITGWSKIESDIKAIFYSTPTQITAVTEPSETGGYGLRYKGDTRRGMIGSPLVNRSGCVVGIHQISEEEVKDTPAYASGIRSETGFHQGIPINEFLENFKKLEMEDKNEILKGMRICK